MLSTPLMRVNRIEMSHNVLRYTNTYIIIIIIIITEPTYVRGQ